MSKSDSELETERAACATPAPIHKKRKANDREPITLAPKQIIWTAYMIYAGDCYDGVEDEHSKVKTFRSREAAERFIKRLGYKWCRENDCVPKEWKGKPSRNIEWGNFIDQITPEIEGDHGDLLHWHIENSILDEDNSSDEEESDSEADSSQSDEEEEDEAAAADESSSDGSVDYGLVRMAAANPNVA